MNYTRIPSKRNCSGSGLLEIVASMFILATAALIVVNIGVLVFAAWRNDAACIAAGRAAAQRTTADDAKQAAQLVLSNLPQVAGSFSAAQCSWVGPVNLNLKSIRTKKAFRKWTKVHLSG